MNPLLGGCCSLLYGVCVAVDAVGSAGWRLRPAARARALPVVLAVAWGCGQPRHGRRRIGARDRLLRDRAAQPDRHAAAVARADAGAGARRAAPGAVPRRAPARSPARGILVGLFLLYFVRISEASWVGFRAGQILLVSIPMLLARTLRVDAAAHRGGARGGHPRDRTADDGVDTWNAQDIGNRRPGPGFRWTLWTTPAQQEAFAGSARTHRRPRSSRWNRWSAAASTGR